MAQGWLKQTHMQMIARPLHWLARPPAGLKLKSLPEAVLERRATSHFKPDPVPPEALQAILELATQAPSGYNLQPWRFIVVQDPENRQRLRRAAMNQEKVAEAPVVIIALGMREESKRVIDEVVAAGTQLGAGTPASAAATAAQARKFLEGFPMDVWVNRHTMIAFTTLMLLAEAYGLDTAPMEGFDPESVKREFQIPAEAEVVALLAIGRMQEPDKRYSGRFPLSRTCFSERYGTPWPDAPEESPRLNPSAPAPDLVEANKPGHSPHAISSPGDQTEKFFQLLTGFDTAVLLTHGTQSLFCARPMVIAQVDDNCDLWFLTGADSAKVHEIETDTRVHVVCQEGRTRCVSISGRATLENDRARVRDLWKAPFRVWFPLGVDDPNLVLIHVRGEVGEYWDNKGLNRLAYAYQALKAAATGTTPEVIEGKQHGRVNLLPGP